MAACDAKDGGYFCAKADGHVGKHESCGGHAWCPRHWSTYVSLWAWLLPALLIAAMAWQAT